MITHIGAHGGARDSHSRTERDAILLVSRSSLFVRAGEAFGRDEGTRARSKGSCAAVQRSKCERLSLSLGSGGILSRRAIQRNVNNRK